MILWFRIYYVCLSLLFKQKERPNCISEKQYSSTVEYIYYYKRRWSRSRSSNKTSLERMSRRILHCLVFIHLGLFLLRSGDFLGLDYSLSWFCTHLHLLVQLFLLWILEIWDLIFCYFVIPKCFCSVFLTRTLQSKPISDIHLWVSNSCNHSVYACFWHRHTRIRPLREKSRINFL